MERIQKEVVMAQFHILFQHCLKKIMLMIVNLWTKICIPNL